jgi:uncharacterized YceG family protein
VSERWDLDDGVGGVAGYGNDPWAAHRTGARPIDPFAVESPDQAADISVGGGPVLGGPGSQPLGGYPAAGGGYGGDAFSVGDQGYGAAGYPAATTPAPAGTPGYSDTTAAFFGSGTGVWPSYQAPEAPSGYEIPGPAVAAPYVGGPYLGDSAAHGADSAVAYTETSTGYDAALGYSDGGQGTVVPGQGTLGGAPQAGYQQAGYPTGHLEPVQTGYLEPVQPTGYLEAVPQTGYQEAVHQTGYQEVAQQPGYQQAVGYPDALRQHAQPPSYDYQPGYQQTGVNPSTGSFSTAGYQQPVPAVEHSGYQQPVPAVDHSGYQQPVPAVEHSGYQLAVPADQQTGYQAAYPSGAHPATGGHVVTSGYATQQYLADPYPRTGGLARPVLPAQPTSPGLEPGYAAVVPAGYPDAGYPAVAEPAGYDASGQAPPFGTAGGATQAEAYPADGYPQGTGGYHVQTARYGDEPRQGGTGPRRPADLPAAGAVPPPAAEPGEGAARSARRGRRAADRRTEALNFRIDPPEDLYAPAEEDYADEPRGRFDQVPAPAPRRAGRAGARGQNGRFVAARDHADAGLDDLEDSAEDRLDDRPNARAPRFERPRRDDRGDRARRRRAAPRLVAMLLVLAVLLGGGIYAGGKMIGRMTGSKAIPDYPGPGSGTADVKVAQGATATDIAGALFAADVVRSRQAFITAAANDPNSVKIQPGTYRLKKQMSAVGALAALLNTNNSIYRFTLAPGLTADTLITALSQRLGVPKQTYQDLIDHPQGKLDLPSYANGMVEGYLLPGTYDLDPKATPAQTLNLFVDAFKAQATKINLEAVAQQDGMTPAQIVTVASIIQMEVPRIDDGQKVARVIYNRLNDKTGKYQKLDMDSTTRYAVHKPTGTLTQSDLNNPSPYNTRLHTGLPPGAIASPDLWALTSALHPYTGPQGADGQPWYYFVALPKSNVTIFASESEWPAAHARFLAEGGVG